MVTRVLHLSAYFLFLFGSQTYPQINLEWVKYFNHSGGLSNDEARAICFDNENNVIVAGTSWRYNPGTQSDYKITKYDALGNLVWDTYYHFNADDIAKKIFFNGVNGFLVSGNRGIVMLDSMGTILGTNNIDYLDLQKEGDEYLFGVYKSANGIVTNKLSLGGTQIWSRTQPTSSNNNYSLLSVFSGINKHINVFGNYRSFFLGHVSYGTTYLKYDSAGNQVNSSGLPSGYIVKGIGNTVSNTNLFMGYKQYSEWASEVVLYKINTNNSILDTVYYNGPGNGRDEPNDIAVDNNGNIYIACKSWGVAVDYDFVVLKFNSAFNLLWEYRFNGSENAFDSAEKIKLDSKGNIYASGLTTLNSHGINIYTVKLSPEGEPLWSDKFSRYNRPTDTNYINDLQLDDFGNIYICGKSRNSSTQKYDYMVLKYSNLTSVKNDIEIFNKQYYVLQNYPNPFNSETKVIFRLPDKAEVKINVFYSNGKKAVDLVNSTFPRGDHEVFWNASGFSTGVYFISLESGGFKNVIKTLLIK